MQKTLFRCLADTSYLCSWAQPDHGTGAGEGSSPGSHTFLFLGVGPLSEF